MSKQRTAYRSTPTNPAVVAPRPVGSAIEDLDDFLDEVDAILDQEEAFALRYLQKGGE